MKITIGGYYGFDNLGDEITLSLLIRDIKSEYPDTSITVISKKAYGDVKTTSRSSLREIREALSESEIFILGGGSLIQDATSTRSLFYYCELIKLAHRLGNQVYILGGGMGPLSHREYAADALRLCRYISVRDKASEKLLSEMGIPCVLSADRIFTAPRTPHSGAGRYFTVNLRECAGRRQVDTEALADALYPFICEGLTPIYVSMQDAFDLEICKKAAAMTGGRVVTPRHLSALLDLHRGARFAVGMRLHFLLCAALTECPALSLSYDPKSACLDFPSINAFSFRPYSLTNAIRELKSTPIPKDAHSLCQNDISALGKCTRQIVENGQGCLK